MDLLLQNRRQNSVEVAVEVEEIEEVVAAEGIDEAKSEIQNGKKELFRFVEFRKL